MLPVLAVALLLTAAPAAVAAIDTGPDVAPLLLFPPELGVRYGQRVSFQISLPWGLQLGAPESALAPRFRPWELLVQPGVALDTHFTATFLVRTGARRRWSVTESLRLSTGAALLSEWDGSSAAPRPAFSLELGVQAGHCCEPGSAFTIFLRANVRSTVEGELAVSWAWW